MMFAPPLLHGNVSQIPVTCSISAAWEPFADSGYSEKIKSDEEDVWMMK
jgi:hypothetical protein